MINFRIFKVGSRVQLRGLVLQGTGVVTKIGRTRATVRMDTPALDARCKADRERAPSAFEYKHLRLIASDAPIVPTHDISGSEG